MRFGAGIAAAALAAGLGAPLAAETEAGAASRAELSAAQTPELKAVGELSATKLAVTTAPAPALRPTQAVGTAASPADEDGALRMAADAEGASDGPAAPPTGATGPQPPAGDVSADPGSAVEASAMVPEEAATTPVVETATVSEAEAPQEPLVRPESAPLSGDAAERIEAARQALLRQLARAADEGLIELADREDTDAISREDLPPETEAAASEAQIRARTAVDIARDDDARLPALSPRLPAHCLGDERFETARWASDAPFADQIGPLRRVILGEFDRPEPDAVLAYARLMVRFGFGAEARAALAAFAGPAPIPAELIDMAHVVDREAPPPGGPLRKGLDCPGAHGAWSAVAAALSGELDASAIDVAVLTPEFSRTPASVRAALVAPVATVALDGGRVEAAEQLAGVAERRDAEGADADPTLAVLTARIDAARGLHARAEDRLAAIASRMSPAGVEAMIRLVEIRLGRGLPAPDGLAENMEAVAFSLADTDLARRLLGAAAQARSASDGLGPALDTLSSLSWRAGDEDAASAAARDMLESHVPEPDQGARYAEAVLTHLGLIGDAEAADAARVAIARNFSRLGVQTLGERVLEPALRRGFPAARLVAAEAAMAEEAPERALAHLADLEGADAARIRAAAFAALGRPAEAAAAAALSGDPAFAANFAWTAGDWERAQRGGEPDRRLLAAWMSGATELPADLRAAAEGDPRLGGLADVVTGSGEIEAGNPLEKAKAALEAGRARRAVIGDLMSDG